MQQNGSKYCSRRHTATSGVGQKIKHFFLKSIDVEDQNGVYSTLKVQMSKITHTRSNQRGGGV